MQVAPTDPFAAATPANQTGVFFPDTQVEPRLAVDPTNSRHMVGVWQQERWDDGGSFGARELRELAVRGLLLPTDAVWKLGVEKGVTAAHVKNLFPIQANRVPGTASEHP